MGIPSKLRDAWASRREQQQQQRGQPVVVASPVERKAAEAETPTREAVFAGTKSAIISGAVASVPVLVGCRVIPWAKANLNYTAQALLISSASVAGFFIAADKTIMERADKDSRAKFDKTT